MTLYGGMHVRAASIALAVACVACSDPKPKTPSAAAAPSATQNAPSTGTEPNAAATTVPAPARQPSAIGDAASVLPHAIVGLTPQPLAVVMSKPGPDEAIWRLLGTELSFMASENKQAAACAGPIIDRAKALYEATVRIPIELVEPKLLYGVRVDELVKCIAKLHGHPKPAKSKDPRIARFEHFTLAQVAEDWVLWTHDAKGVADVLSTTSTAPNPLGQLTTTQPASGEWRAYALDYTQQTFGVPSLGLVAEYEKPFADGPVAMRFVFADAELAKRAASRFPTQITDEARRSAFGEPLAKAVDLLKERTKLTVEGAEVVLRGKMTWGEWDESPLSVFGGLHQPSAPLAH